MRDDEATIDCIKCERDYGFVELWTENEFIVELFSVLNSKIVSDCFLQDSVFRRYESTINEHGGFERVIALLSIISKAIDDRKPKSKSSSAMPMNRKHARKHGLR